VPVWGIVVAAGSGQRFGEPKQFLSVAGRRMVDRAVEVASRCCDGVVLVLPPGRAWDGPTPVDAVVGGGATRSASVRAGLAAVPETADVVVVHDAARPLATVGLFEAVIRAVRDGAAAAVPGVPVADTIKRVSGERVLDTVPRADLVAVQTPQAFASAALRVAHATAADDTDDAALVEAHGGSVVVVPGDPRNVKVTSASDLVVATALLEHAEGASR
jgi:2-C-methyl-D-erythritol 4-phosphate cytidylyltransferase